jgi:hypothetical protein
MKAMPILRKPLVSIEKRLEGEGEEKQMRKERGNLLGGTDAQLHIFVLFGLLIIIISSSAWSRS